MEWYQSFNHIMKKKQTHCIFISADEVVRINTNTFFAYLFLLCSLLLPLGGSTHKRGAVQHCSPCNSC